MNWFMETEHLSIANVLVIAHTVLSISLLSIGSPFMRQYFQVQVVCHLQVHSLDDDESSRRLILLILFVLHVYQAKGLFCIELVLFFCVTRC